MHPGWHAALTSTVTALRRVTQFTLPPVLDRRFLDLGGRKEELRPEERDELMTWVAFTRVGQSSKTSKSNFGVGRFRD
jgi:hypothetical protein